jgi:hypothetical protein
MDSRKNRSFSLNNINQLSKNSLEITVILIELTLEFHIDKNLKPDMAELSLSTTSLLSSHQSSSLSTPTIQTLAPTPLSRVVTFTIPSSKSSISYSVPLMTIPGQNMASLEEADEQSK